MLLHTFYHPELSINTYLIGDPQSNQFAVIDPIRNIEPVLEMVMANGYNVTYIIETHVHADFVSGAKELKYYLNSATICCSQLGGSAWTPQYADKLINDGDEIPLGACHLKAMHTPGHSQEHVIWLGFDDMRSKEIPCICFTGDLLFVGSVGRPDLLGEEQFKLLSHQLYLSLFKRLKDLPSFLEIYPAHGPGSLCSKSISARPSSTWGYECRFNPFLKQQPEELWTQNLLRDMPSAPASFAEVKQLNIKGSPIRPPAIMKPINLTPEEIEAAAISGAFIIDTRNWEAFALKHLKGAVNIPLCSSFCSWAGMTVQRDHPLIVIVSDEREARWITMQLCMLGLDNILGFATWKQVQSLPFMDSLKIQSADELADKTSHHYVLDVRSPAEWNAGHIENAHHIELARLPQALNLIPKDQPITVTCAGGLRASAAASLLQRAGYKGVANLKGGMNAWRAGNFPISHS